MSNRGLVLPVFVAALAILVSCKPSQKPAKPAGAVRQTQATVVSIRTTAGSNTTAHAIVIANNRARSTDERDTWRLFDTSANTVTLVDDIEKTYRVERLDALLRQRQARMAKAIPGHFPSVKMTRTDQSKVVHGVISQQAVISAGGYRRELWFARHPSIPVRLFTLMQASDPPSTELAPMMRSADELLLTIEGFPLIDHSEVAGIVVDRTVTAIQQKPVAEALLEIPKDYRDVTPKPPVNNKKKNG